MSMRTENPLPDQRARRAPDDALTRFLGGSPIGVIFRLALLSILVGVILEALGLDLANIVDTLQALYRRIWNMGFDAVRWLVRYLVLGAAIVVPLWLVVRLAHAARGR